MIFLLVGLTPESVRKFLEPIVKEQNELISTSGEKPIVTVSLNTSSCYLFAQIINDVTLN